MSEYIGEELHLKYVFLNDAKVHRGAVSPDSLEPREKLHHYLV